MSKEKTKHPLVAQAKLRFIVAKSARKGREILAKRDESLVPVLASKGIKASFWNGLIDPLCGGVFSVKHTQAPKTIVYRGPSDDAKQIAGDFKATGAQLWNGIEAVLFGEAP